MPAIELIPLPSRKSSLGSLFPEQGGEVKEGSFPRGEVASYLRRLPAICAGSAAHEELSFRFQLL